MILTANAPTQNMPSCLGRTEGGASKTDVIDSGHEAHAILTAMQCACCSSPAGMDVGWACAQHTQEDRAQAHPSAASDACVACVAMCAAAWLYTPSTHTHPHNTSAACRDGNVNQITHPNEIQVCTVTMAATQGAWPRA